MVWIGSNMKKIHQYKSLIFQYTCHGYRGGSVVRRIAIPEDDPGIVSSQPVEAQSHL